MRVSAKTLSIATAALIVASPVAFAQSRDGGPADAGMKKPSAGMTTKGDTETGRSTSTMGATTDSGKMTSPTLGVSAGSTKGTATGGAAGTPGAK